ncbi:ABC transporter substrate-binding protein [Veillonella criceti]|uniref:Probable siderophore-binding lipoprotein yfiY n=1 Tax=Veillonella criceti TaxID=103891 RepID=A0A380NF59_9FIRM|nr:ABC transporter substrate-binding protein [Veillonella criceti]SUP39569.1 Probable siderophore-binding lipoprotein yfiY precursor [Veillonella criceti]
MRPFKRILTIVTIVLLALVVLAGCGKTDSSHTSETRTITYKDQTYTVPANPQRIATLANSLLNFLDAIDGQSISRVDSSDALSDKLKALPSLGQTANINMEELLSLKPDLVIGLSNQHGKYEGQLQSNQLPHILVSYDGIKDNVPLLLFLGELTHHETKAKEVVAQYNTNIDKVKAAIKNVTPARVAVLRATGKAVTAETELAVTAAMVKELGMTNVVLQHGDFDKSAKTIPYSLETLAADDPDIIFISTMGKKEDITKTMEKEMTSNPAWQNLTAVKNGKVYYLPSNLFLLNPGLHTPDAMAELVNMAYGIKVDF